MNLPNLLSFFRLVLTLFFIILAARGHFRLALFLFILQAVSDMLDGFFARRMGAKTHLGSYLDPLADKIMLASSYIVLCLLGIVPLWLMITVLTRDLVISLGFLVLLKRGLTTGPVPSFISKTTTVFQMLTVVYVLWSFDRSLDVFFFWATALLTVGSGIQYVMTGWMVFSGKEVA
jgi:cardiolipin synthase